MSKLTAFHLVTSNEVEMAGVIPKVITVVVARRYQVDNMVIS